MHIAWRLGWSSTCTTCTSFQFTERAKINHSVWLDWLSLSLSLYLRVNMHKNVKVTIASSVARDLPACPCSKRVQYFFQHLFDSDRHEGSWVGVLGRQRMNSHFLRYAWLSYDFTTFFSFFYLILWNSISKLLINRVILMSNYWVFLNHHKYIYIYIFLLYNCKSH